MNFGPWFLGPRLSDSAVALAVAVVAGVVLLLVGGRWLRLRPYLKVFRIASRRDDALPCRGEHPTFPISAAADGFDLPASAVRSGQTAFLIFTARATTKGWWSEPFIEIGEGTRTHRQYFERGVSGRRYLNLSPLFDVGTETSQGRIRLRGSGVRWKRPAELLLFDPPPVKDAQVLVVAPHPDDAEIAAFGLYARARSWVVTLTTGEAAMADLAVVARGPDAAPWHALVRMWDSLTIPQLGGVPQERCINLVYPDNQLRAMYAMQKGGMKPVHLACETSRTRASLRSKNHHAEFQGASADCTWDGLVEELRLILEKTKPDIVVCPHPIIDGHHDHVFATVALEQAARRAGHKDRLFFLYVIHRRDVPMYPFGPSTALASPPPWDQSGTLADRIYSHALSPDERLAKYFAIEASHDLRTYSVGDVRTFGQVLTSIKREVGALLGGTALPAASFIRRAPRPNELFYVVSAESLSELVHRALTREAAAETRNGQ